MPGFGIFVTALLTAALLVVVWLRPAEGMYLLLGTAAALGVILANGLKEGVDLPVRASIGSWVFFALGMARATQLLAQKSESRVLPMATAMFAALYSGHLLKNTYAFTPWLTETRALAEGIPSDIEEFAVYGHIWGFPGAREANIHHYYGFMARVRQVAGVTGVYCDSAQDSCHTAPPFDPGESDDSVLVRRAGNILFIRMSSDLPEEWFDLPPEYLPIKPKA